MIVCDKWGVWNVDMEKSFETKDYIKAFPIPFRKNTVNLIRPWVGGGMFREYRWWDVDILQSTQEERDRLADWLWKRRKAYPRKSKHVWRDPRAEYWATRND